MKHGRRGNFFVFEGKDGVGKTSLIVRVADLLTRNNIEPICMAFPGKSGESLGGLVYKLHHDAKRYGIAEITPFALQTMHVAAHVDVIERSIIPALDEGHIVLLDRYWWSTIVYGTVASVPRSFLKAIIKAEQLCWHNQKPLAVFLITRSSSVLPQPPNTFRDPLAREYAALASSAEFRGIVEIIKNDGVLEEAAMLVKDRIVELLDAQQDPGYLVAPVRHRTRKRKYTTRQSLVNGSITYLRKTEPVPTVVYDTYWRFAAERQKIYYRRISCESHPWTADPIMCVYKFTNAYRASDRVSQYLIKHVIYDTKRQPKDIIFRILLFKTFNKIGTWNALEEEFGEVSTDTYSFESYDRFLSHLSEMGAKIYSGAYIMASGKQFFGYHKKHRNHLKLIESIIAGGLHEKIPMMTSMEQLYRELRSYPTIGNFLAYQYAIDINYSELTSFNEMDFVAAGPGAKDGIRKCFSDLGGLSEEDIIKYAAERQEIEFERLHLDFKPLWGRPLQLIDCQNLFCEVDKYARLAHPDVNGISGRKRIKQKFVQNTVRFNPWYPPKWGLNKQIEIDMEKKCL
jgi:thymidylate kinase